MIQIKITFRILTDFLRIPRTGFLFSRHPVKRETAMFTHILRCDLDYSTLKDKTVSYVIVYFFNQNKPCYTIGCTKKSSSDCIFRMFSESRYEFMLDVDEG